MKPEPIYKTIGAIIRRRRRRLDLNQVSLAQKLGMSRATLANIETGRQRVLVHHLYAFAEILEMKPSDFLPPASPTGSHEDWSLLPIPSDLKPEQKDQIARLIGPQTNSNRKEKSDAKSAKTIRRGSR